MQFDILNLQKKKTGTIELNDSVFGLKPNLGLVHQVLTAQLAGRRQGTAKTKVKSEVRGGGRKPFKQKGTGNARQGSTRSPLNPGGGQSFGPQPRSYVQRTPKEMVRGALRSVLSDRVQASRLMVLENFTMSEAKTKKMLEVCAQLGLEKALVVDAPNHTAELAARNIPGIRFLRVEGLNVYDIVRNPWLVMTKAAIESIQARLAVESKE